jgi:hypothetical protein
MSALDSLKTARATLVSRRADTSNALFDRETARQARDDAKRTNSIDLPRLEADLVSAQSDLDFARAAEATARQDLNTQIKNWLTIPNTTTLMEPDADYARMARLDTPVTMFPVRLETRFDIPNAVLHVRIYPDEILSDIHERELTAKEQTRGRAYWDGRIPDGFGNLIESIPLWTQLAKDFGVPRAAYIVRATETAPFPARRATVPSRAAEAVLPDRFVAVAFRGGAQIKMAKGLPIPEPLTLTPDPSDDAQMDPATLVEVGDSFKVPASVGWTVNYTEALNKGMAIDIPLTGDDLTLGFDRLVVFGVKTSMAPEDAVDFIGDMFDGHHYTRGLDLVPQGTPTNNVPGRTTPFTMEEPTGQESFTIERTDPLSGEPSFTPDFVYLSRIFGFGFNRDVFTFLRESSNLRHDIWDGIQMRRVLWYSTLGYFMSQMMNPEPFLYGTSGANAIFPDTATNPLITNAKNFFYDNVSAQGPAPAFRVGAVPYGVLPAIAVSRMVPSGENADAIHVMSKLVPYWKNAAAQVPTVPRGSANPGVALMNVISQKPGSDGAYIRNSVGPQTTINLLQIILQDWGAMLSTLGQLPSGALSTLGHSDWATARIFGLTFMNAVTRHAGPIVTGHADKDRLVTAVPGPSPGQPPADPKQALNYLTLLGDNQFLRNRELLLGDITSQSFMENVALPNELLPLLYMLARHSLLLEVVEIARKLLPTSFPSDHKLLDFELWDIHLPATAATQNTNIFQILGTPVGQGRNVFDSVISNKKADGTALDPSTNDHPTQIFSLQTALNSLANVPVHDLERLTMETLDLASHRLDAWITGLAFRRLNALRTSEESSEGPAPTNYFGAWGFLEDIRPVARTSRTVTDLGNVDVQPNNGGFIHAPSLRHASGAAILRAGRMAEKSNPTRYAIELPSERARRSRALIDGVREGQALGALLGAELESGLRAQGIAQHISNMESYILALRTLYPQVANKSGNDAGLSADRIAARNVVDGQKVRDAATPPKSIPFGTANLPAPGSAAANAITSEIGRLNEIMDGIGDLVLSEAVYQMAGGDPIAAEAAMSFLPQGNNPPDPEVTSTPTVGIAVNHRVALLLEGDQPDQHEPAAGWTPGASLRAAADTFVERWVGSLLRDPSDASATVTYQLASGPATQSFTVDQLEIGALDFLALAQSTATSGQRSPLDRLIVTKWFATAPAGATDPVVSYDDPPATGGRSIPQLIELARALGAVLGGTRELAAADLRRAEDGVREELLNQKAADLILQATDALGALGAVRDGMDGRIVQSALLNAYPYIADAFPDPEAGPGELGAAAIAVKAELARRFTDAQNTLAGAGGTSSAQIATAIQALRTIFGRNTLVVLPEAVPQGGDELAQSLPSLARTINFADPTSFDAHQAPGRFLQQTMRVREQLGPWRRFTAYAGAFGTAAPLVSVAQLPFVENEDWAGRSPPPASRTSLIFVSADGQTLAPDPTQTWRGLLLDQWVEVVPSGKAETALAFHYDSQNAEAPQVILMAMHSGTGNVWKVDEFTAIVNETMDLAVSRPVDNDIVALGGLVPPIALASNSQNNIVSTKLGPDARQGPPRVG